MKPADEERIAARLAKLMAMICVRNTKIEDLHARIVPVAHKSDYQVVFITDAEGRQSPCAEACRLVDVQMRHLMRQIVDRLYTFYLKADDLWFRDRLDRWLSVSDPWDEPKLDVTFFSSVREAGVLSSAE